MALNCIVDDSALIAGLPDLEQWVREGLVNLFVPIHTLERLNIQRNESDLPSSSDAHIVLHWLDEITSQTEGKTCGRVQLQGPDDQYQNWKDVERFLLPDTPLSSLNPDPDDLADALDNELTLTEDQEASVVFSSGSHGNEVDSMVIGESISPGSKFGNNDVVHGPPKKRQSTTAIPPQVRPLLNFVVWRTHREEETPTSDRSNILLTNDVTTQKQASKFGVRAKLLNQVRSIVARDRQKDRPEAGSGISRASNATNSVGSSFKYWNEDDNVDDEGNDEEDEVVFEPSARPVSSRGAQDLFDPNHFGRATNNPARAGTPVRGPGRSRGKQRFGPSTNHHTASPRASQGRARGANTRSPRAGLKSPRASASEVRGVMGRTEPNTARSRRGSDVATADTAGRGGPSTTRTTLQPQRGPITSSRGKNTTGSGRSGRAKGAELHIDPDSFDRPPPRGRRGRGLLWQPT